MKKFGEIVRAMMRDRGFSRRELARRADLAEGTAYRVFNYTSAAECRQSTKEGLAQAFGLDYDEFLAAIQKEQKATPPAAPVPASLNDLPRFLDWFRALSERDRRAALGAIREFADDDRPNVPRADLGKIAEVGEGMMRRHHGSRAKKSA